MLETINKRHVRSIFSTLTFLIDFIGLNIFFLFQKKKYYLFYVMVSLLFNFSSGTIDFVIY